MMSEKSKAIIEAILYNEHHSGTDFEWYTKEDLARAKKEFSRYANGGLDYE